MKQLSILRVVAKISLPYIFLFAFYVQFHGEYGPGGGFQAGAIFAAGFVLYLLLFGLRAALRTAPLRLLELGMAGGLAIFIAVGFAGLVAEGHFLDYSVLAHDPVHGQHLGILLIEFGVGLTVAATLTAIVFAFAALGNER